MPYLQKLTMVIQDENYDNQPINLEKMAFLKTLVVWNNCGIEYSFNLCPGVLRDYSYFSKDAVELEALLYV